MRQRSIYTAGGLLLLAQACSAGMEANDHSEEDLESSSRELGLEEAASTLPDKALLMPVPFPDPEAPMCGGIAALRCPGTGRCVDDPYDDCDPRRGGSDCSGLCVCLGPRPGPVPTDASLLPPINVCGKGRRFDSSPEVCACVRDVPDPCAVVLCPQGSVCVAAGPRAICVPRPLPSPEL